ncbi:hypothetical protein P175DRAFT_0535224 [Aspergillus ochraceoroseus IBT 24754]|uniref:GST N-terminal domain-containing protein n=1 Tax=Aspergillus ochraceoroseus IBT 24754 TaxID=1392256 RepID=A0A2T5LPV6_9EURO|nr:uncharacterized protein P175DRAFT_0535224 [Aspergillus ochraceoroseus IBT 24754]PTU18308.1 hypothetical protein P175DRAFT_0535224 [Aspergillus ochraceoroseus IBT 24754]
MSNSGLRSPDPLPPLQPLLSSVAENASNLAAEERHQHHNLHNQHQHPHALEQTHDEVDHDAQSLQPLQSVVEGFDHYDLRQQHHATQSIPQGSQYRLLLPKEPSPPVLDSHAQPEAYNPNKSIFSSKEHGYLRDLESIVDPPDLEAWRERLFHLDDMIVLSEEQFRTYFPHVDNIYSHRSTQHYKRKPLVSHYWDCRLKGRPPGTPKSDDPAKKKRKRTARQRDLCDVKIKITEYFPGYAAGNTSGSDADFIPLPMSPPPGGADVGAIDPPLPAESLPGVSALLLQCPAARDTAGLNQPFGVLTPSPALPEGHPGANGQRFFTIQRVNGNGANGKHDGVSGGHRHSLEESDRVKKNSVQRFLLKEVRERKKSVAEIAVYLSMAVTSHHAVELVFPRFSMLPVSLQPSTITRTMSAQPPSVPKTYHTKATGSAAETVANHSKESDLKLYGSCFCPFVQRVWIALELKGIPYEYIEVDPYQKPQSLLEVNPRGLVPALRHGSWGSYESSVLLEYIEDLNFDPPLLPQGDAKLRAHCRLWTDFINRHIVPNFYRLLQEQDQRKQIANAQELHDAFNTLVAAADTQGPFFLGPDISFVDVQVAPWMVRLSRVLKPYRGWPEPEPGSRWAAWVDALEANEHIQATTSTDDLYLDSYERYAENRPNTSQLANAINSGKGLP